jgi:4-hydroxythreonine-4-phosphate dehydrogenase
MLAIALGDPTGIGPEVALKAVAAELPRDSQRYLFIGDARQVHELNGRLDLGLEIKNFPDESARVMIATIGDVPMPLSAGTVHYEGLAFRVKQDPGAPEAARFALACLRCGAHLCLQGKASGLVTAPVNKEAIIRSGATLFVGQTELLSEMAGTTRTAMMLLGTDDRGRWLRVALATIHVPIREVAARLTREKIELAVELAAQACRDLGLSRARVAVCGLNPHAGEGGKIGDEEITTIIPAVEALKQRGFDVHGPFAADALFYYVLRGDYDAVVAMYHDQGLVPLKMIGFERGVNWTLGLPFIRTSPDHGTAYDIAGKGIANPSSMIAAIQLAKQLACHKRPAP